jgi:hypothetical protein
MQSMSIASLNENQIIVVKLCLLARRQCSSSIRPNLVSTTPSILKELTVLIAWMHSPANPTLSAKVLLARSSKLFSIASCRKPAPNINGKAPKMATRASFQSTARERMRVLRTDTPTTIMTPIFGPAKDFRDSGSVARRESKLSEEFDELSKNATRCLSMLER